MIPGTLEAARLGLEPGQRFPTNLDECGAFVLGRLLAAAEHLERSDLVIDHGQLSAALADAVAPHFGPALDIESRRRIAAAATRDQEPCAGL